MAKNEILDMNYKNMGKLLLRNCELDPRNEFNFTSLEAYMLIAIIETYLANIGNNISINKITLRNIGNIYKQQNWDRNTDGMFGQCFERSVYNSILTNDDNVAIWIKKFLSELDNFDDEERPDVLLWGNEKGSWIYDSNKHMGLSLIKDTDQIEINNEFYKFKEVLKKISTKGNRFGGIGKSDLFVKQKNSNFWYGVSVKLNVEDLLKSNSTPGIKIGVALKYKKIQSEFRNRVYDYKPRPYKDQRIFVFPKEHDLGEEFYNYFIEFNAFLKEITNKNLNCWRNHHTWRNSFFFIVIKNFLDAPILEVLNYLDKQLGCSNSIRWNVQDTAHTFLINGYDFSNNNMFHNDNEIIFNL